MKRVFCLTLIIFLKSLVCLSQTKIAYYQKHGGYYRNSYLFVKSDSLSNSGRFYRIMTTHNGQEWFGSGNFIESKRIISLSRYYFIEKEEFLKINDTTIISIDSVKNKKPTLINEKFLKNSNI